MGDPACPPGQFDPNDFIIYQVMVRKMPCSVPCSVPSTITVPNNVQSSQDRAIHLPQVAQVSEVKNPTYMDPIQLEPLDLRIPGRAAPPIKVEHSALSPQDRVANSPQLTWEQLLTWTNESPPDHCNPS